ncbi:MAG: 2,3,4,5-tetrahydropyridine-2,6-dicarboxylate N-succinyltransferase, partial [Pseudolabrys sp.]
MANDKLASIIDEAFEGRDKIGPKTKGAVRKAVNSALDLLDAGDAR